MLFLPLEYITGCPWYFFSSYFPFYGQFNGLLLGREFLEVFSNWIWCNLLLVRTSPSFYIFL